jgi:hypothetical protein
LSGRLSTAQPYLNLPEERKLGAFEEGDAKIRGKKIAY